MVKADGHVLWVPFGPILPVWSDITGFALVQVRGPGLSCLRPRFKLPLAPVYGAVPDLNPGLSGTLIRVRRRHNPGHAGAPAGVAGYNPGLLSAPTDYNSSGNRTRRRAWPVAGRRTPAARRTSPTKTGPGRQQAFELEAQVGESESGARPPPDPAFTLKRASGFVLIAVVFGDSVAGSEPDRRFKSL